jgi:hypothetical protein
VKGAQLLYYLHIPKSAGTSVRRLFASVFEDRLVEVYGNLDAIRCAPDSVLFGHFCFSLHKRLGDPAPRYMTVLRDPVDRVISWYRHQTRASDSRFYREIHERGLTLGEIIDRGLAHEVNNHSVRMICTDSPLKWQHARDAFSSKLTGKKFYQFDAGRHLKLAFERIRRSFCFVGVVERFDLLLNFVAELAGKTGEFAVPKENIAPNHDLKVDTQTLDLIKRANRLDYELFEAVYHGRVKSQFGC